MKFSPNFLYTRIYFPLVSLYFFIAECILRPISHLHSDFYSKSVFQIFKNFSYYRQTLFINLQLIYSGHLLSSLGAVIFKNSYLCFNITVTIKLKMFLIICFCFFFTLKTLGIGRSVLRYLIEYKVCSISYVPTYNPFFFITNCANSRRICIFRVLLCIVIANFVWMWYNVYCILPLKLLWDCSNGIFILYQDIAGGVVF